MSAPQLALPREHDRRERLVDLDDVDVGHLQPVAVEQVMGRVDRAGEHQHRVDADEALVDDAGPRSQAELARRATVVRSTAAAPSVICDDVPAVCTPFSRATGLSAASFSSDVSRSPSSRVIRRVVAGGRAVVGEGRRVDRYDLTLEAAFGPRLLGAFLRQQTEAVAVVAGDAPLVGDALGALELRGQLVVLHVRLRGRPAEVAADRGARAEPATSTRLRTTSATSTTPDFTSAAARFVACCDEPHCESTVVRRDAEGKPGARATRCGRC